MKLSDYLLISTCCAFFGFFSVSCEKESELEEAAEEVGDSLEDSADELGDAIEDAADE